MTTRHLAIVSVAAAVIMWLLDALAYFPHVLIILMLAYIGSKVEAMSDELLNIGSALQDLQPLADQARELWEMQVDRERDRISISDQETSGPSSTGSRRMEPRS